MKIHEYQAKALLKSYGVPVLAGGVVFRGEEAEAVARSLGSETYVVKAQIHAGGRGAGRFLRNGKLDKEGGGGVRLVSSLEEVGKAARDMLGAPLVTKQTGKKGKIVKRLYIEEGTTIEQEFYLSLLLDKKTQSLTFVASSEGGVDIEEVALQRPEKILKESVHPLEGIENYKARKIAFRLGLNPDTISPFVALLKKLYQALLQLDATLIEINPLILTEERWTALDAKMLLDDNAAFRHKEWKELRDDNEEEVTEKKASDYQLNYVRLDGNIGCMVNGAGLAMATMDVIQLYGGKPANFLDVGGGTTKDRVKAAFDIILSDKKVKGILVNIFGGIVRCDVLASGILAALEEKPLHVPLVIRLEGTHRQEGIEMLNSSSFPLKVANTLREAALSIIECV